MMILYFDLLASESYPFWIIRLLILGSVGHHHKSNFANIYDWYASLVDQSESLFLFSTCYSSLTSFFGLTIYD